LCHESGWELEFVRGAGEYRDRECVSKAKSHSRATRGDGIEF
jgi:hypothetical protein